MHGSNLTPQMALKHAYFWLRYLATIVAPEVTNVAFLGRFAAGRWQRLRSERSDVEARRTVTDVNVRQRRGDLREIPDQSHREPVTTEARFRTEWFKLPRVRTYQQNTKFADPESLR